MTEVSNVANTVLTTLDIGSGIDSTKLAQDLTDAVKIPQKKLFRAKLMLLRHQYRPMGYEISNRFLKASFEKLK